MTLSRIWLSAAVAVLSLNPAFAADETNYTYLALGDSVSFGLDATKLPPFAPADPEPTPNQFVGYPEKLAATLKLTQSKKAVNASCPGETSTSFITGGADNGCNSEGPQEQPPFKTEIGLHIDYFSTQQQFAIEQLAGNKHINLVTLSIGGNDLLLLAQQCSMQPGPFEGCVGTHLFDVKELYRDNLTFILASLRTQYKGRLVLVHYYSPTTDPLYTIAVASLNTVMTEVGSQFGAIFADSFTAFQQASAPFAFNPCTAGLLVPIAPGVCDIHPSPYGRDVIAQTILDALGSTKKK